MSEFVECGSGVLEKCFGERLENECIGECHVCLVVF